MEHALLVAGLLAVIGSVAGFLGRDLFAKSRPHRPTSDGSHRAVRYVRADFDESIPAVQKWLPPVAQARGSGWIYEAFTPPEVTYDARRQEFIAIPSRREMESRLPEFELVDVRREPFRLQLLGYVGGEGSYRGVFENLRTGEVTLAGPGQVVPELGLVITDFQVTRRGVTLADGTSSGQWVAGAVVRDGFTGQTTELAAGQRSFADALSALVAGNEEDDQPTFELREGEEFRASDLTYRVEHVRLDPPAVELTQRSARSAEFTRFTLTTDKNQSPRLSGAAN
jgi:hypothetical protein